jgi:tetratricopeptide (TPR) repeat protein
MLLMLGFGFVDVAMGGTTIHFYWGATTEENRQLSGLAEAQKDGQLAELAYLDQVLKKHPENVHTRGPRAHTLVQMGRMDEAMKDLDEITRKRPDYFGLAGTRAYYYRVKADRARELEELRKLVAKRLASDPVNAARSTAVGWSRARIAELLDNLPLARKEWQAAVDEAPPQERASHIVHQVMFYLRHGDYKDAATAAKTAVELNRRYGTKGSSLVDSLTWHGFSLWLSGKRTEALAAFFEAAERAQDEDESNYTPGALFDRKVLAIASARALATHGAEEDKALAAKLMSDLGKSATHKNPYSLESAVMALSGQSAAKPVADTVAEAMKQAPNLDWALWTALYLGLSGDEEAKHLLKLLPEDSIQKRIAEREGKISPIRPAAPRPCGTARRRRDRHCARPAKLAAAAVDRVSGFTMARRAQSCRR